MRIAYTKTSLKLKVMCVTKRHLKSSIEKEIEGAVEVDWRSSWKRLKEQLRCEIWVLSFAPSCIRGAFASKPIVPCLHSIIDCPPSYWLSLIRWGFAGLWLVDWCSGGAQLLGHLHFTSSALILTSSLRLLISTLPPVSVHIAGQV